MPTDYGLLLGVSSGGGGVAGPFGNHATLGGKIVAHWKMNETSGQRNDAHSGAYHLTDVNTVTYATGKIGNSALFTRANSEYLQGPTGAPFNIAAAASFTLWWKATTLPSANMGIVGKWTNTGQFSYRLWTNSSNALSWSGSPDGTTTTTKAHSVSLATGTWYFLYCYFDGSNLGIAVDNGAAQTAAFSGYPFAGSDEFRPGRMLSAHLGGEIDSLSFWNSTLSAGELTDLYNSGNGLDY